MEKSCEILLAQLPESYYPFVLLNLVLKFFLVKTESSPIHELDLAKLYDSYKSLGPVKQTGTR